MTAPTGGSLTFTSATQGTGHCVLVGSKIYALAYKTTTPFSWSMWSFDADTGATVFTEHDSTNAPDFDPTTVHVSLALRGFSVSEGIIHMIFDLRFNSADHIIYYMGFDTSDDTWITTSAEEIINDPDPTSSAGYPITSNGNTYVLSRGTPESSMGSSYQRFSLFKRTGTDAWTEYQPSGFPDGETLGVGDPLMILPHGTTDIWLVWNWQNNVYYYPFDTSNDTFGTNVTSTDSQFGEVTTHIETKHISSVYYHSFTANFKHIRISCADAGNPSMDVYKQQYGDGNFASGTFLFPEWDEADETRWVGVTRVDSPTNANAPFTYLYDDNTDTFSDILLEDTGVTANNLPRVGLAVYTAGTEYDYLIFGAGANTTTTGKIAWWGLDLPAGSAAMTGAWTAPSPVFYANTGAFSVENVTAALTAPSPLFQARTFDFYQTAHAFSLSYNIPAALIRPDYKTFYAVIDTGADEVSVPMIRFSIRRIGANIQAAQTGSQTIDLVVPEAYADTLAENIGNTMTIHSTGNYQGGEYTVPIAKAEISKVTTLIDRATVYCEREYIWIDRPDSNVVLDDTIFRSNTQTRTIFRSDVEPGMSVIVQGIKRIINQVTMYVDSDSGLTDFIYRS